jgi:hypothetical protein
MKRLLNLALWIGALVAVIMAAWLFHRPPLVTVVVVNSSEKPIQWAHVVHRHGTQPTEVVQPIGAIAVGERRTIRYRSPGESEYELTVHFADGSEVRGGAGYAETGSRFTETVSATAISSSQESY